MKACRNSDRKDRLRLALVVVLLLAAGLAHGASQFILAGGVKPTTGITVDDGLDVFVNGVAIYSDGPAGAGTRPPIPFMGNVGDVVHVVVHDTFGTCSMLSPLYVFNSTFQAVLVDPGFDRGCLLPPVDQGVSYNVSFPVPAFTCSRGDILVASIGKVLRVDPLTGKRSLLSDFTNPDQGPTGVAQSITAGDCDGIYVTDQASDQSGKLFKVFPNGLRTLLSDAKNVGQGMAWYTTSGLGVDLDGSVLVTDRGQGGGGIHSGLWSVDPTSGFRTRIIDSGALNGGHSAPTSVVVDAGGNTFIGDVEGPAWLGGAGTYCYEYGDCGTIFFLNRANGTLTALTDFGNPAQGPRGNDGGYSLVLDNDGTFLTTDPYYSVSNVDVGALFRVNPAGVPAGARTVLTTQLTHFSTVALGPNNSILLGDCNAPTSGGFGGGICIVDRVTGAQTVLSDFGNAAQGPTGLPFSIAVLRGGNVVFASGFEPP